MGFRIQRSWLTGSVGPADRKPQSEERRHQRHPSGQGEDNDRRREESTPEGISSDRRGAVGYTLPLRTRSFSELEIRQAVEEANRGDSANEGDQGVPLEIRFETSEEGPVVSMWDGTGQLVRRMSGQEFMELRGRSRDDKQARGKIIDERC